MSTSLTVVFVILAILALLGLMAAIRVRSKLRKAKAYLVYTSLSVAVKAMKERAAKPEHVDDQELAAVLKRAETAKASAKAALNKAEYNEAVKIMLPSIEEWAEYKRALNDDKKNDSKK
jgi:biopolymer transport protein ExbD